MRIEDVIYFSPNHRALDIDFDNVEMLVELFQSRIENYYFAPTRILLNSGVNNAFAVGVMIVSSIDAITYYTIGGPNRIKVFFAQLPDFRENSEEDRRRFGNHFDQFFRNGLIHEGRIKNASQFSYAFPWLLTEEHSFMIINPKRLHERVEEYFNHFVGQLRAGNTAVFKDKFIRQFRNEVLTLRQHYQ